MITLTGTNTAYRSTYTRQNTLYGTGANAAESASTRSLRALSRLDFGYALKHLETLQRTLSGTAGAVSSTSGAAATGGTGATASPTVAGTSFALAAEAATYARLRSSERLVLVDGGVADRTPAWSGADTLGADIAIVGDYDGSAGSGTLTFLVDRGGVLYEDNVFIKVFDPDGNEIDRFTIGRNDAPDATFDLGNGLSFSLPDAQGGVSKLFGGESASVALTAPAAAYDAVVDPDAAFDASGGTAPGFQPGLTVGPGSFTVNGERIDVLADDTLTAVLAKIDAADAGVRATFDALTQRVEIVSERAGSAHTVALGADSSGFLAAVKLDGATPETGLDRGAERALGTLDHFAAVASGSFRINGQSVSIDTSRDSLRDVLDAIEASGAGVIASLRQADGAHAVTLAASGTQIDIEDDATGLFAALGISARTYGSPPPSGSTRAASPTVAGTSFALAAEAATYARLRSSERLVLVDGGVADRTPAWSGADTLGADIAIVGDYDGSAGSGTLTFLVDRGGVLYEDNVFIKVFDPDGNEIDRFTIGRNDAPDATFDLGNGLSFSLPDAQGGVSKLFGGESASVALTAPAAAYDAVVDPDAAFDASGGTAPGFQPGLTVGPGSFTVNGERIDVLADDTLTAVLAKIDAADAGVRATFDALTQRVEIVSERAGSAHTVALGADSSGFLAAVKLDGATPETGLDRGAERALGTLDHFAAVASGSFRINGQSVSIDTSRDSLRDVLDAIEASGAGVIASLRQADGAHAVTLAASGTQIDIEDDATGLFAALGISARTYGSPPPSGSSSSGGLGSAGESVAGASEDAVAARRRLSYKAADSLEKLQDTLDDLLSGDASDSLRASVHGLIEEVLERFGESRLRRLGLEFDLDEGRFLEFDRSARRRFTQAVQRGDDTLRTLMFGRAGTDRPGLIEALRELVETELRGGAGGTSLGSIVDRYA